MTDHALTHLLDIPTDMSCDACGDLICASCAVNASGDTVCPTCGHLDNCVNCEQPTFHYLLNTGEMGYTFEAPGLCPSCLTSFEKDRDMDKAGSEAAWKGDA